MRTNRTITEFLRPKARKKKTGKRFYVLDLESKRNSGQEMGFKRPFLAIFREPDGKKHYFRDDPSARSGDWNKWSTNPGGCLDKLLRHIFKDPRTQYGRNTKNKKRKEPGGIIYAHGGGRFDFVHLLRWFHGKAAEYDIEIIPAASSMIELTVRRIARKEGQPLFKAHHRETGERLVSRSGKKEILKGESVYGKGKRVVSESDVVWSYAHQDNACWKFRDSLRVLSGSLDNIAKDFGIKGKQEIDLNLHEDDPLWDSYCAQDCDALAQILESLRSALLTLIETKDEDGEDARDGVEIGITIGATGMDLFRRYFLADSLPMGQVKRWIGLPKNRHFPSCKAVICKACGCEECVCEMWKKGKKERCPSYSPLHPMGCAQSWFMETDRAAFHGGRTEVFWVEWNEPNLRYFDANSMYASMMLQPLPVGRIQEHDKIKTSEQIEKIAEGQRFVFIEADVYIPEDVSIPPLPLIMDDKLCFPIGRFRWRGAWCEARHLEEIGGRLEKIHKVISYHAHPVLAHFSKTIFEGRRAAKKAKNACMTQAFKLIGNASGFGKFCQSPVRTLVKKHEPGERLGPREKGIGEGLDESPRMAPFVLIDEYGEADFFLPHLAAGITALARETLWVTMNALQQAGCTVVYCDTDSVIFAAPKDFDPAKFIPVGNELGQWKDEMVSCVQEAKAGATFSGIFPRPKQYQLRPAPGTAFAGHGQHRHEGNKRLCDSSCTGCSETIIHWKGVPYRSQTRENFAASLAGKPVDIGVQPPSFREVIRSGRYETREVSKVSRGEYDKREVLPDGSTRAWVLPNEIFGQEDRDWLEAEAAE